MRKLLNNFLTFLFVAALIVLAPFGAFVAVSQPGNPLLLLLDKDQALTFEGAMAIAEELDRIADQLEMPAGPGSEYDLHALAAEILPYFQYEGLTEENVRKPNLAFTYMPEDGNFHVRGRYTPAADLAALNWRLINPYSAWYRHYASYSVLIHELGHSQGYILFFLDEWGRPKLHEDVEPANQLATLEVLAAMSRTGTAWAFPVFLRELQGYADDFAWSLALQQDRMDELKAHLQRISDRGAWSDGAFARTMDHWKDDMDRLEYILEAYGERPYRLLVEALSSRAHLTQQLDPVPNGWHRIEMNDTAWLVDNLHRLARDYPALLAKARARAEG